jgi:type I restriction enzyme S subunit
MKLLDYFKELTIHPKNAKELKGLILQLAVQGKLTQQWRADNPAVEPASALLAKINEEKEQLINDKKIKKEKSLPAIAQQEIPYELPETWEYSRLANIATIKGGKRIPKGHQLSECITPYVYIRVTDMKNGSVKLKGLKYITQEVRDLIKLYTISKEDLYITIAGTIGDVGEIPEEFDGMNLTENAAKIMFYQVDKIYLKTLLRSRVAKSQFLDKVNQMAQPKLALHRIASTILPIPPLEEQKAIVKTVNRLFAEVEQLEEQTKARIQLKEDFVTSALQDLATKDTADEWSFLQTHFQTFFTEKSAVKKLRETVLQLAVQGKLTQKWRADNPDVEPASKLLEKIKAEKEQLIKDKKIKKEKPLPAITEEEIPYELPEGWEWCRLGQITNLITDGKHGNCQDENNSGYYFLSAKDVKGGELIYGGARQINFKEFKEVHQRTNLEPGDLCIVNTGATVGKTAIAKESEFTRKTTFQKSVAVVKVINKYIEIEYLQIFIINQTPKLLKKSGGSAINNLLLGDMKKIVTPLPPKFEQRAIVEKVNALMSLCDQLEQEIEHNTQQVEQLMQSCLKEVFEG